MIDINEYLERLDEEEGREEQEREAYQRELFEAYVLRRTDHEPERRELMRMYRDGHPLTGPRGLRKRLAAIDLVWIAPLQHTSGPDRVQLLMEGRGFADKVVF